MQENADRTVYLGNQISNQWCTQHVAKGELTLHWVEAEKEKMIYSYYIATNSRG